MVVMLSSTAVTSFNYLLFLHSCGKSTWRIQRNLFKNKSKPQKKLDNSWHLKQNNIAFFLCNIWLLNSMLSAAPLITSQTYHQLPNLGKSIYHQEGLKNWYSLPPLFYFVTCGEIIFSDIFYFILLDRENIFKSIFPVHLDPLLPALLSSEPKECFDFFQAQGRKGIALSCEWLLWENNSPRACIFCLSVEFACNSTERGRTRFTSMLWHIFLLYSSEGHWFWHWLSPHPFAKTDDKAGNCRLKWWRPLFSKTKLPINNAMLFIQNQNSLIFWNIQ